MSKDRSKICQDSTGAETNSSDGQETDTTAVLSGTLPGRNLLLL